MEYFCKLIFSCFRKLISSHIWNHNCSDNHLAAEKFTRILTLETKRCLFTCEQCGISLLSCFKSPCLNMNSLLKSFLDTNINMLFLSKSFLILLSVAFCWFSVVWSFYNMFERLNKLFTYKTSYAFMLITQYIL
jgi:hypothetical protein